MIARLKVVLAAAVTWLVAVSTILTIAAPEIAGQLPEGAAEDVTRWALTAVGWIGAAVTIIRRSTPVLPAERGLLPQPPAPPAG